MSRPVATAVALNDSLRQTAALQAELSAAINRVVVSGRYILGPECTAFEAEFAEYCGVKHCVSVANGTDALELALRALNVAPGDTVATAANAGGYATAAIRQIGAQPLYVDIDPVSMCISAADLEARLTRGVRAVVATHLYGQMAGLESILRVTERAGIPLVEDCAQSHGAAIDGRKAGSWGAIACFSFYPTKNLGALGDGGAVTTSDTQLSRRVLSLRQYGWSAKYHVAEYGRNSRMDEIQAALLRAKLPHLDGWNTLRREIAAVYNRALAGTPAQCPSDLSERYVAHLYVIRAARRREVRAFLSANGIATDIHYPVADHLQAAAAGDIGRQAPLPATERAVQQILTVPCYPELREEEIESVAAALQAVPKEYWIA